MLSNDFVLTASAVGFSAAAASSCAHSHVSDSCGLPDSGTCSPGKLTSCLIGSRCDAARHSRCMSAAACFWNQLT